AKVSLALRLRLWRWPWLSLLDTKMMGYSLVFQRVPCPLGDPGGGSKAGGAVEYPLRINFSTVQPAVPVKAPVAAPKPIPQIPPSLLTPAPILFEEDQDTLSQLSTRQLHEWVSVVKDHQYLGIVIANGTVPLQIQAFASTTGTQSTTKGKRIGDSDR